MNSKPEIAAYSSDLLLGKRALVTGAGKGIGREVAVLLCQAGADVVAAARTESDLIALQSMFPEQIEVLVGDVSKSQFVEQLAYLEVDILVNNVGTNRPRPFIEVTDSDLDMMVDLNFKTLFKVTQAVAKSMLDRNVPGSIVNIGSQMGHVGSPDRSVYCATKHAVEGLTKAVAVELAVSGIRVNTVAPTFVKTPLTEPMFENQQFRDFVMSNIPMNRLASMRDVANAVVFLASELSSSTTGACIKVDGGWTAQ